MLVFTLYKVIKLNMIKLPQKLMEVYKCSFLLNVDEPILLTLVLWNTWSKSVRLTQKFDSKGFYALIIKD
jgi:hypothetical protein